MKRIFSKMILLIHVCCLSSCRIAFAIAASQSERVVVEKHTVDNSYKLTLVRKQDWAGPWYYGYEVRKKVCGIYMPKKYYWCNRDSVNNCIVRLNNNKILINKCTNENLTP